MDESNEWSVLPEDPSLPEESTLLKLFRAGIGNLTKEQVEEILASVTKHVDDGGCC